MYVIFERLNLSYIVELYCIIGDYTAAFILCFLHRRCVLGVSERAWTCGFKVCSCKLLSIISVERHTLTYLYFSLHLSFYFVIMKDIVIIQALTLIELD